MEIQYQRDLKGSYMVIMEQEGPLNPDGLLAERMLENRTLPGLLHWSSMEHEGQIGFWYRISGCRSLSDHMQEHELDQRLLQLLFALLLRLQEELPRFYLKSKHLLLRAEQIFLHTEGQQLSLCYEPMWEEEPSEALQRLLEELLPHIDHSDKAAVALAYGAYERCQQPNADLWQYIWDQSSIEETDVISEEAVDECMPLPQEKVTEPSPRFSLHLQDKVSGIGAELKQQGIDFIGRYGFRKKKEKESASDAVYLFEPEEEPVMSEHPTVYLGMDREAQGRLSYQGGGNQSGFSIAGDSFLIGSSHGTADGQIHASEVSRTHARITKEGEYYFIEDLNSKNGTYLNDELLQYRQKRCLKPGDRLRFATEEYTFY